MEEGRYWLNSALQKRCGREVDRGLAKDRQAVIGLWHDQFGTGVRIDAHCGNYNFLVSEFEKGSDMQDEGKGYLIDVERGDDGMVIKRWAFTPHQRDEAMRIQADWFESVGKRSDGQVKSTDEDVYLGGVRHVVTHEYDRSGELVGKNVVEMGVTEEFFADQDVLGEAVIKW